MSWSLPYTKSQSEFIKQVEKECGHNVATCYQCGKCTAGCPIAYTMDYPPHQIIRGVQLGMRDVVLSSRTIWLCAACETCSTRCPQEVDPAGVMDALRRIAYAEGIRSPEREVPLFHTLFLTSVRLFGRIYEAGLIGFYNILSGYYFKDLDMAPKMLLKGKLNLLPSRNKRAKELGKLFAAARQKEASE